jgi:hypothetical protein
MLPLSPVTSIAEAPGGRYARAVASGALVLASACSDDDDGLRVVELPVRPLPVSSGGLTPGSSDPVGEGTASPESAEPLYAVGHTIYAPEGPTSYLTVVRSLMEGGRQDTSGSLEVAGAARPYGMPGMNKVYLTSSENGTITEVTFDADGRPEPGRVVSFANLGINDTSSLNLFLSATKAYHINQQTLDVVVWNPEMMTVTSSFATGLGLDAGYESRVFPQEPILVGDRLLLVSGQWQGGIPERATSLTVVDTAEDRIISTGAETRCHSLLAFARDAEGDTYFISSSLGATAHFSFPELVPAPCMLRIRSGETTFDPAWSRSLTADLGTSLWTGIAPGSGGSMLVQGIAEDAPAVLAAATDSIQMANVLGWTWYRLADADAAPVAIETTVSAAQYTTTMTVDGQSFMTSDDGTDSTLVQTTSPDGPASGIVLPGYVWNIVRIR